MCHLAIGMHKLIGITRFGFVSVSVMTQSVHEVLQGRLRSLHSNASLSSLQRLQKNWRAFCHIVPRAIEITVLPLRLDLVAYGTNLTAN